MTAVLYRRDGIVILLVGLTLAGVWLTRPVTIVTGRVFEDERVVTARLSCGQAVDILVAGEYHEEVPGPRTAQVCAGAARTRAAGVLTLATLAVILGGIGIRNGPYRPRESVRDLRPIPPSPEPMTPTERLREFLRSLNR